MIKIFEWFVEMIGWLRIVASPLFLGVIAGIIIYGFKPDESGLLIAAIVTLISLIIGIIWATRILKKQGTNQFLSRIMATPELDKINEDTEETI
jgi:hypothetical protein